MQHVQNEFVCKYLATFNTCLKSLKGKLCRKPQLKPESKTITVLTSAKLTKSKTSSSIFIFIHVVVLWFCCRRKLFLLFKFIQG